MRRTVEGCISDAPNQTSGPGEDTTDIRFSLVVPRFTAPAADLVELAQTQMATASEVLAEVLVQVGVTHAFGVLGGAIAPLCEALERSPIELLHFRHEAAAAFAAAEASLATDGTVVVYTTTGPGFTNALTGIFAARWEGAKVIVVSGCTSALHRGRFAFQETSDYSMPPALCAPGALFHYAAQIEQAGELDLVAAKLAAGISRPGGFVAHLAIPIAVQTAQRGRIARRLSSVAPPRSGEDMVDACAGMLAEAPFIVWMGFGARGASREIRTLVERTGALAMSTPRGKGTFPERHPQYLGNTGIGGNPSVETYVSQNRPPYILVLGSRLGEGSTSWSADLTPSKAFVHVDIDAEVFGAAYPTVTSFGIQSDVKSFVQKLLASPRLLAGRSSPELSREQPPRLVARASGPVRPQVLMQSIQEKLVNGGTSIVMAEAGNSALWANSLLRFEEPSRYRVSTGFGSMGQAVTGVVGAAMASKKKAFAIVGDGAMLMFNEVNTAVQYNVDATWIVLNDAQYGMIEQGMRTLGWEPFATALPRVDFVSLARAVGADGIRVEHETALDSALATALARKGPFVIDVEIDRRELSPSLQRNQSLMLQLRGA